MMIGNSWHAPNANQLPSMALQMLRICNFNPVCEVCP